MFTWKILEVSAKDGVITHARYHVTVTEKNKLVDGDFTASTYGTVGYTQEDKSYKPYADLTQAEVIGWVQESLGKDTVEAGLTAQIEAQKNPVQETGLPWVTA
jgi:YbbR domain-containing protein